MEAVKKAEKMIQEITEEAEIGKTYTGKIVRIEEYGAFVKILPNVDGLLHISEISQQRIRNVRDVLKMGQILQVKVISIDENNKIRLSKKALEHNSFRSSHSNSYDKKGDRSSYQKRGRNNKNRF